MQRRPFYGAPGFEMCLFFEIISPVDVFARDIDHNNVSFFSDIYIKFVILLEELFGVFLSDELVHHSAEYITNEDFSSRLCVFAFRN